MSLLEVVASYFIDKKGWSRQRAAWLLGGAIFLFGVPSALSAVGSDYRLLGLEFGEFAESWTRIFGMNFFDTMDYLASNWMLPLGGLFIAGVL